MERLSVGACLGQHYNDRASALSGKSKKEKAIALKRVDRNFHFDLDGNAPSASELEKVGFPIEIAKEDQARLFFAGFAGLPKQEDCDTVLRIDGTFAAAEIYLNGELTAVVEHVLMYVDVRVELQAGNGNKLFLRLRDHQVPEPDSIRSVNLLSLPKSRIDDLYLRNRMMPEKAELLADVVVTAGDVAAAVGGSISVSLIDDAGTEIAKSSTPVPAFRRNHWATVRAVLAVESPRLWSVDDPYRYTVLIEFFRTDGSIADVRALPYGIRELKLTRFNRKTGRAPHLLLNGFPMFLKGAVVWNQNVSLVDDLKRLGFNAIRLVGAPDLSFVEACDAAGMLLMCEAVFAIKANPKQRRRKKEKLPDPLDRPMALLGEMVSRLKNSASVFCWSLGSRGPFGNGVLREFVRSMDDTRAIQCEGDFRFVASDFFSPSDCGMNELSVIAEKKTVTDGKLLGLRVPFSRYMHRPLLLCEASKDDMETLKKKIQAAMRIDHVLGIFVDIGEPTDLSELEGLFPEESNETGDLT